MGTNITLLKATEVDELFSGSEDKFKAVSVSAESSIPRYFKFFLSIIIKNKY